MTIRVLFVFVFAALVLGCLGGQTDESSTIQGATVTSADSGPGQPLADADVPFIEEGDAVEIGEMI
ncbi:MAG: hypothetical protein V1875_09580 [Candidatus Altiarchaeota archaeon]